MERQLIRLRLSNFILHVPRKRFMNLRAAQPSLVKDAREILPSKNTLQDDLSNTYIHVSFKLIIQISIEFIPLNTKLMENFNPKRKEEEKKIFSL